MARVQRMKNKVTVGASAAPLAKIYCIVVAQAYVDVLLARGADVCLTRPIRRHLETKAVLAGVKAIHEGLKNGKRSLVIELHFPT